MDSYGDNVDFLPNNEFHINQSDSAQLVGRQEPYKHKWTPYLLYCNLAGVIGSAYLFGYQGVMVNEPYKIFQAFINSSYETHHPSSYLKQDDLDNLWTLTVSLFLVGGMFGGLLGGPESNYFGRRKSLLLNTFIGLVGGALQFSAPYIGYYEMLLVGRAVGGFHCGLISGIVPVYVVELSPLSLRGKSGTINQLSICFGGLTASILGLPVVLGRIDEPLVWPFLFFPLAVLPVFQLIMLFFAVESPRWLMVVKGDEQAASEALRKLRGGNVPPDVIEAELRDLVQDKEVQNSMPTLSFFDSVKGAFRWPLVICVMMQLTQQLSGINAAIFYSDDIFSAAGLEPPLPEYASLGVVGTTFFMTFVSIFLIEKLGRRSLMIIGVTGMLISSAVVTILMVLAATTGSAVYNILTIVALIVYVATFAIGPGPIPWFIAPELSLLPYRSVVISVCTFVNWAANLAIGFGFPPVQKALGPYSFMPFFGLLVLFDIFAILFLPETKGRTPEESVRHVEHRRIQANFRCLSSSST